MGTWSLDKSVRFWTLDKSGELSSTLKLQLDHNIRCVAFNGRIVAVAKEEEPVMTIWDFEKKNVIANLNHHESLINSLSFNTTGEYLASCSEGGEIRVVNIQSLENRYLKGHRASVNKAIF